MFVFDPEVVHQCSMECLGLPKPQMFDVFGRSLAKHYPKVLDFGQPWVYSIAGGARMISNTGMTAPSLRIPPL